jgi:TetR/AcrR family fatty acid metabolism transcriptional regulator
MTKSNDKYHRILEAAVKVFARHGFHGATVAEIAREAGVADGTIYLYFKNKDDILVQFFSYKTRQVFGRMRQDVEKAVTATGKLRNLIRRHLAEFQHDTDMARLYQAETRRHSPLVAVQIKEMAKTYLDIVDEIIAQGRREGTLRRDFPMGLGKRFVLGAVEEVIATWLHSGGRYDLASMADPLVDLFMRGLGNPRGPRRH